MKGVSRVPWQSEQIVTLKAWVPPEALAEAEMKFTDAVLTFAKHAMSGRVHYSRVSGDITYDLAKPDPAFLYNIGQCHRQLGDLEQAATLYRRFLTAAPNTPLPAASLKSCDVTPATGPVSEMLFPLAAKTLGTPVNSSAPNGPCAANADVFTVLRPL